MNIEIFVAGHKASAQLSDNIFIPIHVGRAGREASFCEIGDDTGDNISSKNDSFCELTALYWIWKNTRNSDYVGLFHYRRHLNFSAKDTFENEWGVTEYESLTQSYIDTNNLTASGVESAIQGYDIILPRKWDVRNAHSSSMYDHYNKGPEHFIRDYDAALEVLKNKYPEYSAFVKNVNNSHQGYFTNMFVMKRDIFDKYCEWLFDILFELEKNLDISTYSLQERRIFGYLSEWLFNIFIEKLISDRPDLKLKTLQRTFIVDTSEKQIPAPAFSSNNIPVVMAFNDSFAPYAGTAILSALKSSSQECNYDFLIFDGKISDRNKLLLTKAVSGYKNVSIRYLNPTPFFHSLNLPTHMHFSRDIYYRLYIPEVCSQYERVIYIDGDTIIKGDLSKLFDTELNGNAIAAVQDCIMINFRKLKVPSIQSTGSLEAEDYLSKYLKLKDPSLYFQSGVLLFDIKEASKRLGVIRDILENGKTFWFPDQDILNITYQGHVQFLDDRWNVFHGNGDIKTFFEKLPYDVRNKYFKSRQDPLIVHYAGERKPWLKIDVDFAEDFWEMARETPWYESMLSNYVTGQSHFTPSERPVIGIRDVGRAVINPLAPIGTKRRRFLRSFYHFMRRALSK